MSLSRRFGLFTLAATVTFSTAVFAAPTFINILTGGTSGVYYPFKAAGLSYEDMGKVEYLPYAESVELIKNRQLDATLQSSGLGMAAIRDLASTMPITFVAIPADVVAKIDSPAYHAASIPAGTYDGQEQDVPTVAIDNILVSHSGVSDELAYQMTKLMFDNLPRLVTAHAAAKDIALDKAAKNLPIPLHPGAERFYKEKGVLPE